MGRVSRLLKWIAQSQPRGNPRRDALPPAAPASPPAALRSPRTADVALGQPSTSLSDRRLRRRPVPLSRRPCLPSTNYGSSTPAGLTPNQIRGAYGLGSYTAGALSNGISFGGGIQGDGSGQTIAIVDAYDYPTALSDLNAFSTYYGLPNFNGTGDPTFEQLTQTGQPVSDFCRARTLPVPAAATGRARKRRTSSGPTPWRPWPTSSSSRPPATGTNASNLYTAVQTAATTPGVVVVSMSWSLPESTYTASQVSTYDSTVFTSPSGHVGGSATLGGAGLPGGVTFLAASGDYGPYGSSGSTTITPEYPATSPNVVAVGGTTLTVSGSSPNYTYGNETAWGSGTSTGTKGGGGGGISALEPQPSYQSGVVNSFSTTFRTYPDVSADANPTWVCPFTIPMTTALQHPGAIITAAPASPRRCGPASSPWPTKDAPSQGWDRSMAAPRPCRNSTSCRPPTSTTSPQAAPAPRPRTVPQWATTWPRASAAPWAICSFRD